VIPIKRSIGTRDAFLVLLSFIIGAAVGSLTVALLR